MIDEHNKLAAQTTQYFMLSKTNIIFGNISEKSGSVKIFSNRCVCILHLLCGRASQQYYVQQIVNAQPLSKTGLGFILLQQPTYPL